MTQERPPEYETCFPCPCCGYRTLHAESPSWETCPVCAWQDVGPDDWTQGWDANEVDLPHAQEDYARIGACLEVWKSVVRAPNPGEERAAQWKTIRERRHEALAMLERVIGEAFDGVHRDGGVTLHQMDVIDDYGSPAELEAAGRLDPELEWKKVSDEKLLRFGLSLVFLDDRGFRFYIPAYMLLIARCLLPGARTGDLFGAWSALRGDEYYRTNHYGLLSGPQKRAIATFLRIMSELGDREERRDAAECLENYWHEWA